MTDTSTRHLRALLLLVPSVLGLSSACGDEDCSGPIENARRFLDANRSCRVASDCVVVSTGCHTYANGICGQAPLNRAAAESSRWKSLQEDLEACGPSPCSQCLAGLGVDDCGADGFCGPPP